MDRHTGEYRRHPAASKSQPQVFESARSHHQHNKSARREHSTIVSPPATSSPYSQQWSPPPAGLPHHTSLAPGGTLQVRKEIHLSPAKAEDKRVSAISSEDAGNSNRDSQYSNTSTNASGKSRTKKAVGPWRLGATIGKGATGRVRKARHQYTGQDAAVKIISKRSAEMFKSESIMAMDTLMSKINSSGNRKIIPFGIERECVIMKLIDHPNIISLYDMWENRGELYLVLEYVEGGELFNYIQTRGRLSEREAMRIFRQIIAALSYCHSFHICHRDLKPENILLDRAGNVKLVDFGMAALQPANQWLQTSCGSPHYACPEVIQQQPYRGDLADVWSAGVVLYAMISGGLPFSSMAADADDNFHETVQQVCRGTYEFPDDVFTEAAMDLIGMCLQIDPNTRIRTRMMWAHPLMKKYEPLDPLDAHDRKYIGPALHLSAQDCGPPMRFRSQIDAEILHNLHNLWHNVSEIELARRLMSIEPTHERVMYTRLQQFRDRLFENYQTSQIDYSTSDYHHATVQPVTRPSSAISMPPGLGQQHESRFSLLRPGDRLPQRDRSHSTQSHMRNISKAITEGTEESYDPFRPSRAKIAPSTGANQMRITVLRNASKASSRPVSASSRLPRRSSARNPTTARIYSGDQHSIASLTASPQGPGYRHYERMAGNPRRISRGDSRITMGSLCSARSNASTTVFRKSPSYKRNVSFPHQQRRKLSAQKRLRSDGHQPTALSLRQQYVQGESNHHAPQADPVQPLKRTSRTEHQEHRLHDIVLPIRSPRKRPHLNGPLPRRSVSQHVSDDARKLSYQTGATSVSVHDMPKISLLTSQDGSATIDPTMSQQSKPPPPPPADEKPSRAAARPPDTLQNLAKARDVLAKGSRDSGIAPTTRDDLTRMIAHLDRLMQPSHIRQAEEQRRAASTPESGIPRGDTFEQIVGELNSNYRAASEPKQPRKEVTKRMSTIRLVDNEEENDYRSLQPIQPLNVRKKSGSSGPSSGSRTPTQQNFSSNSQQQSQQWSSGLATLGARGLDAIDEISDKENFDPMTRNRALAVGESKKRHWFRRHVAQKRSRDVEIGPPLPPKDSNINFEQQPAPINVLPRGNSQSFSRPPLSHKKSILDLFKIKKDKSRTETSAVCEYEIDDTASHVSDTSSLHDYDLHCRNGRNASSASVIRHHRSHSQLSPAAPQPTNWLARIFRLKPGICVLCFQVPKAQARREITSSLKKWRKHGMRDINVTRGTYVTTIRARVDQENSLHMPPMGLMCEVYQVLFQGRRARMSLARLMQESGSKGTFERLARELEHILGTRGCLVEDRNVVREMRRNVGF